MEVKSLGTQPEEVTDVRIRRLLSFAGPALLVALVVVGCGSSSSKTSNSASSPKAENVSAAVSAAKAAVQKASADITTWSGPESAPPIAKGKSFVVVPCSMAAEGCKRQADGFIEAAKVVGWQTKLIDPEGDPTKMNAAIEEAISLHVAGIYLVSVEPKTVSGPLAEARKDGIVVIDSGAGGPDSKPSPTGLNHEVSLHGPEQGEMIGNFIIADANGQANVAIVNTAEAATVVERVNATKKVLDGCSGCKVVTEVNAPITSLGTELTARVKGMLQAHPEINYVWAGFDSAAANIVQAAMELGLQEKVAVVSFNGDAQNLEYIRKGQALRADIGEGAEWAGWAAADDFNRFFNHVAAPANDGVPSKLLTKENLPSKGHTFEGEYDFRKKYEQLWKVNG